MKTLRAALTALLSLLSIASAFAQSAPPNLAANTVYGRLGFPGTVGPGEQIPFATLLAQLNPLLSAQIHIWTGAQSFTNGTLILLGSSSGSTTLKAPATGGGTATLFAGSDTIMGVATAQTPTNKTFNCANNTCTVRLGSDVTGNLPLANIVSIGANTVLGSVAGGTPIALSSAQITAMLNAATASLPGALPAWPNNTTTYFRGDGSYATLNIGAITGWGTSVATALGVNVGTAGAFIVNGGALGSPSSAGTLPAHTLGGTVAGGGNQINNVIIGASTPLPGSFTTASLGNSVSNGLFFKNSGGSNDAQMYEGSGGIRVDLLGTANAWEMATNGAASVVTDYNVTAASTFTITPNVALAAGVTVGAPTGGNKGAGTVNIAGAFYANGVAVAGTGTVTSVICGTGLSGGTITGSGTCAVNLSALTNSLGADVALSNTASYFDGPSVAQGTSGTWWASGSVTLTDTAGAAQFHCRLWDGTTVIDSGGSTNLSAGTPVSIGLSGYLATPAANIKISCRDTSTTSGKILFNQTGNSKDSTLSVHRIQ